MRKKISAFFLILICMLCLSLISCNNTINDDGEHGESDELIKLELLFEDKTFIYDGQVHSIYVSGNIPDDVSITYVNNGQIEVGVYEVTAYIDADSDKYDVPKSLTAILTINENSNTSEDEPIFHKIIFNFGSFNEEYEVEDGTIFSNIPDVSLIEEREGYIAEWDFDFSEPIVSDIVCNPIYSPIDYKITYIVPTGFINDAINPTTYNIESDTINLAPLKSDIYGSSFMYWVNTDTSERVDSISAGSIGDLNLKAIIANYKIEELLNGATLDTSNVNMPVVNIQVSEVNMVFNINDYLVTSNDTIAVLSRETNGPALSNPILVNGENLFYLTVFSTLDNTLSTTYKIVVNNLVRTIDFYVNDYIYSSINYKVNEIIDNPTDDPSIMGYKFIGWSYDKNGKNMVSWPFHVIEDTSLYGIFIKMEFEYYDNLFAYVLDYDNKTATLTDVVINNNRLIIPDYIIDDNFEYKVTDISFSLKNNNEIKILEINHFISSLSSDFLANCKNLIELIMPKNVIALNDNVFEGCENLNAIYYDGTLEDWCKIQFTTYSSNPVFYGKNIYFLNNGKYELLTNIIIPETVTEIGNYQFEGFMNVKSIYIPTTVKTIGVQPFYGCNNLESITIPFVGNINSHCFGSIFGAGDYLYNSLYVPANLNDVTILGGSDLDSNAFYDCSNIKNIVLPNSLLNIYSRCFYNCNSLTSVIIPANVEYIGDAAFYGCNSLEQITIPFVGNGIDNNSSICTLSYLFVLDKNYNNELVPSSLKEVTVLSGTIEDYAFTNASSIEKIIIEEDVQNIGVSAFSNCSSLNTVIIKSQIENVPYEAFSDDTNLVNLYLPDSILSVEDRAFSNCSSLKSINLGRINSIGIDTFLNCNNLTDIYYVGEIADWCKLKFDNKESNPMYYADNFYMLNESNEYYIPSDLVIPNGIEMIGDYQFYNFNNFESVMMPSSVVSIGSLSFANCIKLKELGLGSAKTFGNNPFENCNNLINVYYSAAIDDWCQLEFYNKESNPMYYADNFYILNSNNEFELIQSIEIGPSIKKIGSYQFYNFNSLTSVIIPANVKYIGDAAFYGCNSLEQITIPFAGNGIDTTSTRCSLSYLFSLDTNYNNELVPSSLKEVTVLGGTIASSAFSNISSIEKIILEEDVQNIEAGAFRNCSSLNTVIIKSQIKKIPFDAFSNDTNLVNLYLPDSILSIEDSAFSNCSSLKSINLGRINSIGRDIFLNCNNLTDIYYAGEIADWCKLKFDNKESNPMYYADNFYMLNESNEYYIPSDIVIPNGIEMIGDYQFYNFNNFESVMMPSSVVSIGSLSFANCIKLKELGLGSAKTFGNNPFESCNNLINVYYYATIDDWCNISFYNKEHTPMYYADSFYILNSNNEFELIQSIEIGPSIKKIGSYQFYNFNSLTSVIIPTSVEYIADAAFYGCNSLEQITIPFVGNGIDTTSTRCSLSYLFSLDTSYSSKKVPSSLKEVTVLGGIISSSAFSDISSIEKVIMGEDIQNIEAGAFRNCSSLNTVIIKSQIENIFVGAFQYCSNLENVYYNGTIENWCAINFASSDSNPMYYADNFYMLNESNEYYIPSDIVIPNSIEKIGHYQFYNFNNLTSIVFSNNVLEIGFDAFNLCSNLENVYYNGTIENWCTLNFVSIASNPMYYADNFYMLNESNEYYIPSDIAIPTSIEMISDYRFYNFNSLTSIKLSSNVVEIGLDAFNLCSNLENIYYNGTIENWLNIKFNYDMSNPMYYADNFYLYDSETDTYYIPENIEVPETITNIDYDHFKAFNKAKYIKIAFDSTIIEYNALAACKELIELSIPSLDTTIGYLFGDSNNNIPSTISKVEILGGEQIIRNAFFGCSNIKEILLPNSILSIGEMAFYMCNSLIELNIPNSVLSIGSGAFSNCLNLSTVNLPSNLVEMPGLLFYQCSSLSTIKIPNGVTTIGQSSFSGCTQLNTLWLPSSIKNVGAFAFSDCSNLNEIYYDGTIENWANIYFESADTNSNPMLNLSTIYFLNDNGNYECPKEIILPDYITEIPAYQFYGFEYVESINISSVVTKIGGAAFGNCTSLKSITLPFVGDKKNNPDFNNFGYIFNGMYDNSDVPINLKEVTILDGLVNNSAFANCTNIEVINIPSNLINIGYNAFYNCSSLLTLNIPTSVTTIDSYAFSGCSSFTNINLPTYLTTISEGLFDNCTSLLSIEIPNSVTSIGERAFYGCSSLTNINIPNSVISIGAFAFENCSKLEDIILPNDLTSLPKLIFFGCTSLNSIVIPSKVADIGEQAFYGCSNLSSMVMSGSIISIGNNAFVNCTSLNTIYYNGAIENWFSITFGDEFSYPFNSVDNYLFYILDDEGMYEPIETLEIPSSVSSIDCLHIQVFNSATNVIIPDTVVSIEQGSLSSFNNIISLTTPYLGKTIDASENATLSWFFTNVPISLKEVYITTDTEVSYGAFAYCSSLEHISLPETTTIIGVQAFMNCIGLINFTLPNDLITLGDRAFTGCSNLENIYIPNNVTNIGNYVFDDCTNLKRLEIYNIEAEIGYGILSNCNNLISIIVPSFGKTQDGKDATYFGNLFGKEDINSSNGLIESLKKVQITGRINIYEEGFYHWFNIEEIILDNVISLGSNVFYQCSALKTLKITNSIKKIESDAFLNCNIEDLYYGGTISDWFNIEFGNNLSNPIYSNGYFYMLENDNYVFLDHVTIPNDVVEIDANHSKAFSRVYEIIIEDGVQKIGDNAFESFINLELINIPDSITSIGSSAFAECTSLINVDLPNNLSKISNETFRNSGIEQIDIPSSVVTIGVCAFADCKNLVNVELSNNIQSLENGVFYNDINLTEIILPDSLTSMGEYIFQNCTSLKELIIPKGVTILKTETFSSCTNLSSVILPDTLVTIESNCFIFCNSLTSIIIPKSVITLGDYAFNDCDNLNIYCEIESKPSTWSDLWNNSNRPVYWGYI